MLSEVRLMTPASRAIHVPPPQLSPARSFVLDGLRWTSAVLVVLGHVYETGANLSKSVTAPSVYRYSTSHAHAAVMVFFVLSGYVMAFATNRKLAGGHYSIVEYFLDRWSRIYSVLIPAIVWTISIDWIGGHLFATYAEYGPKGYAIVRLLANITCQQGAQGRRMELGSNGALWSIGYEFLFYLIYGAVVFRGNFRSKATPIMLSLACLALSGWQKSAYMLVWLLGVAAFHVSQRLRVQLGAWAYAGCASAVLIANHFIEYRPLTSSEWINDFLFGIVIAVFITFEVKVSERAGRGRIADLNARMAGFSYTLYAFHLPMVFFVESALVRRFPTFFSTPVLEIAFTIVCVLAARGLFYPLGEARRRNYRKWMQQRLEPFLSRPQGADLL
jgi:peptidoglycan/LPS O-acetylase OafA/YrhL